MVIDNILSGRTEKTIPDALPMLCNMSGLELTGVPGKNWHCKDHYLDIEGRRYHFGSAVDKWIFEIEPERYKGHYGFIDRFVYGMMPPGPDGVFEYMSMAPEDRGVCGTNYAWAEAYKRAAE